MELSDNLPIIYVHKTLHFCCITLIFLYGTTTVFRVLCRNMYYHVCEYDHVHIVCFFFLYFNLSTIVCWKIYLNIQVIAVVINLNTISFIKISVTWNSV